MIQLPLLDDDPVHRLMLLGYSEREADFLCLVGLQGGYFLRRQYSQFTGAQAGKADAALVDKLLQKGHATEIIGCRQGKAYHLAARGFYAALAHGDNRNRRNRPAGSIKTRLMALDYILDNLGPRYLSTEQEKIRYFTESLHVPLSDLPAKQFRLPSSNKAARFFSDRYPIYVREQASGKSKTGFCFIDEDFSTGARFQAFLREYRLLFSQLPCFEVVYVATSPNLFWEAERDFQTFASTAPMRGSATAEGARLRRYFQDRKQAEAGNWQGLDRARLIQLREDGQTFSAPFFESLYQQWRVVGDDAIRAELGRKLGREPLNGVFSACLLRHRYDLFGSPPAGRHE